MHKIFLAAAVLALPAMAQASEPGDIAAARIGYFSLVNLEMGGLAAMAQGKAPYDAERARALAGDLKLLSEYLHDDLLMPGTSNADLAGKTRALPAIWEQTEDYRAKGMAFREAVATLHGVAGEGQEALAPAVGQVGATCKACHDSYRAKDF
ncbi:MULTISPECIES: cytochrome c [Paracoccus]|uniref:c-type cytochrome n=1 Tax=Paracoccus TaxID=265 RepID=UPI00112E235D|nr:MULTISPECIES: cytochrome c [Paracoccus]MCJ1900922.1 cytochrome c [Paracoccus versutus]MDF3905456.1 cytochrome c [Paracoccus sp. AS002]